MSKVEVFLTTENEIRINIPETFRKRNFKNWLDNNRDLLELAKIIKEAQIKKNGN